MIARLEKNNRTGFAQNPLRTPQDEQLRAFDVDLQKTYPAINHIVEANNFALKGKALVSLAGAAKFRHAMVKRDVKRRPFRFFSASTRVDGDVVQAVGMDGVSQDVEIWRHGLEGVYSPGRSDQPTEMIGVQTMIAANIDDDVPGADKLRQKVNFRRPAAFRRDVPGREPRVEREINRLGHNLGQRDLDHPPGHHGVESVRLPISLGPRR